MAGKGFTQGIHLENKVTVSSIHTWVFLTPKQSAY